MGHGAGAGRAEGRTDYPHAEQHHEWRRYHRGGRAEGERLSVCELVDFRGRPSRFRAQSEVLLGASARYNTANREAFDRLGWTSGEKETLTAAWEQAWDVEQTAATYYVGRCLTNAFRRVVYSYEAPRDVLYRYNADIAGELARKQRQLDRP